MRKLSIFLLVAATIAVSLALTARAQETQDVIPIPKCSRYELPAVAQLGRTTTIAFLTPDFCSSCETESWKRCEEALKGTGANSCDCGRAYVQYCYQQCPTCRHCSLHIYWYQDTDCP
jgi:hypothetical protein